MKIYTLGYETLSYYTVASFLSEEKAQQAMSELDRPYPRVDQIEVDLSSLVETLVKIEDNLSYMYGEPYYTDNDAIDETRDLVLSVIDTLKGA